MLIKKKFKLTYEAKPGLSPNIQEIEVKANTKLDAKKEGNKKFPVHYCYNLIKVEEI